MTPWKGPPKKMENSRRHQAWGSNDGYQLYINDRLQNLAELPRGMGVIPDDRTLAFILENASPRDALELVGPSLDLKASSASSASSILSRHSLAADDFARDPEYIASKRQRRKERGAKQDRWD